MNENISITVRDMVLSMVETACQDSVGGVTKYVHVGDRMFRVRLTVQDVEDYEIRDA